MRLVSFLRCRAGHSSSSYHIVGAAGHHILWCQLKTLYFHLTWSQLTFNRLSVSTVENVKRNYISHDNDVGVAHSNSFFFSDELSYLKSKLTAGADLGRRKNTKTSNLEFETTALIYIYVIPAGGFATKCDMKVGINLTAVPSDRV